MTFTKYFEVLITVVPEKQIRRIIHEGDTYGAFESNACLTRVRESIYDKLTLQNIIDIKNLVRIKKDIGICLVGCLRENRSKRSPPGERQPSSDHAAVRLV